MTYGILAQTLEMALKIWAQQAADGVSREDRLAGLENTLRVAWPQTRPWSYLCDRCSDYGLIISDCAGTEVRNACGRSAPHGSHSYGRPCDCTKGIPFRATPRTNDDFTGAGKVRRMTRVGR